MDDGSYNSQETSMEYWVLNTDEAELEGQGADRKMISRSCVAAWGERFGAEAKLSRPEEGDKVFLYKKGVGIIAKATFDHSGPYPSNDIFGMQHKGEFSRKITDLKTSPVRPLSCAAIESETGSSFRPLQTIFRIKNPVIAQFLDDSFEVAKQR
jgi:hypothetical protein